MITKMLLIWQQHVLNFYEKTVHTCNMDNVSLQSFRWKPWY